MQLVSIRHEEKPELKRLLLAYFKEIDPSKVLQTGDGEDIDYPFLDSYLSDPTRSAFLIRSDQNTSGFVLINDWVVCQEFKADHSIAEFYITPDYRKRGLGKEVAHELFRRYKGKWEIRQSATNSVAINFWRSTINEFTKGKFQETTHQKDHINELVQLFESA